MSRLLVIPVILFAIATTMYAAEKKAKDLERGSLEKGSTDKVDRFQAAYIGVKEDAIFQRGGGAFELKKTSNGDAMYVLDGSYKRSTKLRYLNGIPMKYKGKTYPGAQYQDGKENIFLYFCTKPESDGTYRMFVCTDDPQAPNAWYPYQFCRRIDF